MNVFEKFKRNEGLSINLYEDINITLNSMTDEIIIISLYARVSTTKEQQLDAVKYQTSVLEAWLDKQCAMHPNWRRGKIYVDTKTGRNFNRKEYQKMMRDAKSGKMNYIVFWETSRFGRNLGAVIRECIKLNDIYNVDLYFIDKNIDTRAHDGLTRLVREADEADKQSLATRARVNRGINEKRRMYESLGDGYLYTHRCLGLESRKGFKQQLFIVPDEAETIRIMFNTYKEVRSLGKTCNTLMTMRRKTLTGGTLWEESAVSRCLRNPIYICIEEQDKTKVATIQNYYDASRTRIGREYRNYAYMPNRIERIIDDDLFMEVQDILDSNIRNPVGYVKSTGRETDLFSQLLYCECGGKYITHKYGEAPDLKFYECGYQRHLGSRRRVEARNGDVSEICSSKAVYEWKLRLMFEEIIKHLGVDKENIIKQAFTTIPSHFDSASSDDINNEIRDLEKEIDRLNNKIAKHRSRMLEDIITEVEFIEDVTPMKQKIQDMQNTITKLKEKQNITDNEVSTSLSKLTDTLASILENDNIDDEFINLLVDTIIHLEDDTFIWYLNLGYEYEEDMIPNEYKVIHKKRLPLQTINIVKDGRNKLAEFTIDEMTARAYKKREGLGILRKYRTIKVKVFW